ncbi:hypothetical protein ACKB4K_004329 [Vibrio vulnificus]|uniref:hypothetical protein n=1 Tax=Vibrio vulnificus TaxID=672 RepID=UPI00287DDD57|nr:hypothetical protein [Vibrio vulnificus]ELG4788122.1 hypothetical protein [Vibrio vulnificus]
MQWIIDNKEWFLSGAGIFILTVIFGLFSKSTSMTQKSGKKSKNIQAKRDINIGKTDD